MHKLKTGEDAEVHLKLRESRSSKWLSLSNTNWQHLQSNILNKVSHSLTHLYISNCHLNGHLPVGVLELKQLQTLDISRNAFEQIPDTLCEQLHSLVTLDCSFNKLINLTNCISQLVNLKELNAAHNKIISLPDELGDLAYLKVLNLSENLLREIPGIILAGPIAKSLEHLLLGHNLLATLPPEIGNLSSLEELDISNNRFRFLPACARQLRKLTSFHHSGNEWLLCPPHVDGVPLQEQSSYGTTALEKLFTYIYPHE